MNHCLDTDTLVALGAAVDWNTDEALRHLAECADCRAQLKHLRTLHAVLDDELEPAAGFTDAVVRSLAADAATVVRHRLRLVDLLNPVLAGVTAFFAVALGATGGAPVQLGPAVFLVSVSAAGVTLWWNRTREAAPNGPRARTRAT